MTTARNCDDDISDTYPGALEIDDGLQGNSGSA